VEGAKLGKVGMKKAGQLTDEEREVHPRSLRQRYLASGNMVDVHDPLRLARTQGKGTLGKVEEFMANNKYAKGARAVGDTIDDFSRLAHYIQIRKNTGSAKIAADSVRKYLFNYGELTKADKGIKVIAPFWTWTKNNLPQQIQEFARQPRYYQTYTRAQDALQGDSSAGLAPDYTVDSFMLGRDKKHQTFYNPRLPLTDLTGIGSLSKAGDTAMNMLNPLAKVPVELKTNTQFFNGAPVDPNKDANGGYDPSTVAQYLLRQTGLGNKAIDFFDPTKTVGENLRNLAVGKPTNVDLVKQKQRAYYDLRDKKIAEKKKKIKANQQSGGK
jgi:hypothetical protein